MRFTGTVCRMCKNSLRFSFFFFGVALRNFIKYIYYKYKAFFLSQLKAIKNSKFINTQYNNTGEPVKFIFFLEKNNKPIFRMFKGSTKTSLEITQNNCFVAKDFCSSKVTFHQLKILYADTRYFNLYFFHHLLAWKFPLLSLLNPLLYLHS